MQKIPIDKTRYICFDEVNNTATVVNVQEEIDRANYNIQELEKMIAEAEKKLISTDGLDSKQLEAVEQFNAGLAIEGRTQEVSELTARLSELEQING